MQVWAYFVSWEKCPNIARKYAGLGIFGRLPKKYPNLARKYAGLGLFGRLAQKCPNLARKYAGLGLFGRLGKYTLTCDDFPRGF